MSLVDASTDDKYFNSQAWISTVCNGIKPNKSGLDGGAEGMLQDASFSNEYLKEKRDFKGNVFLVA